jgi:putative transcriptional regulator
MTSGVERMELTGQLLVATPNLRDPNFERSVVLVLGHENSGALGVVLNRATGTSVREVLPGWESLAPDPAVLFEGGPVQPDSAICVARARSGVAGFLGFSRVVGQIGTVDLSRDPAGMRERLETVRVFAGYSGWSPGQLEAEIDTGSWHVCHSLPSDAFSARPDDLWGMVWRRQGGLLAAIAHFPGDPSQN